MPQLPQSTKQPLSLEDRLREGQRIYVRNLTNPRGQIHLVLFDHGSRPIKIIIPRTPHPFCLSDIAPPYALNEGGQMLREIIMKGGVRLVSPKKAEAELSDPETRAALKRAIQETDYVNDEVKKYRANRERPDAKIRTVNEDILQAEAEAKENASKEIKVASDEGGQVNVAVRIIVSQLKQKEISSKDAMMKLGDISDQLSMADLAYLNDQTTGQMRDYVVNLLNKKSHSGPAFDDDDDDDGVTASVLPASPGHGFSGGTMRRNMNTPSEETTHTAASDGADDDDGDIDDGDDDDSPKPQPPPGGTRNIPIQDNKKKNK